MDIVFDYEPLAVHQGFHQSMARYKAMFGAVGSGKTYALCSEAIARALEEPGLRLLLGRKFTTNLRDTTETVFFDILPHELYQAGIPKKLGGHYDSFTFPNGSKVLFRGLEDWTKHKSLNLGWIGIDEADETDEDTLRGMNTRLRQRDITKEAKVLGYRHQIEHRQFCLATNPAGRNWIYDFFVNEDKRERNSSWHRSTSFDNPYLPGDFLQSMMEMPSMWVRRFVLCQFDDFAGLVYPSWNWETHMVPVRKEWPRDTKYFMGSDPGIQAPTAGLWVALDFERRRLVAISEYQEADLSIKEHARNWRKVEAANKIMRVHWRVADPAITTRDLGTNMARSDMYRREGFSFDLGAKTHDVRVPALGEMIWNNQFVAQQNCPMFHEQITKYRWQDLTAAARAKGQEQTERIQKGNDHLVDTAQYMACRYRRPLRPAKPEREMTAAQEFADDCRKAIRERLQQKVRRGRETAPGVIR